MMMLLRVILLSSLLLVCPYVSVGQARQADGVLRGRIADEQGAALAGAVVRLNDLDGRIHESTTDGDGRFQLISLESVVSFFTVHADGFVPLTLAVDLKGPSPPLDLNLNRLEGESLELEGRVTDETKAVLVEALVMLDDSRGQTNVVNTDREGRYRFDTVVPGRYTVTVSAAGFVTYSAEMELNASRSAPDLRLQLLIRDSATVVAAEPNLSSLLLTGRDLDRLPDNPRLLLRRLAEMADHVGRPESLSLYINGFSRNFRLPPKGSIQMIRILANSFDAEFANSGQQRVEIITKPGSQQFYGEFTSSFMDETLNARSPFVFEKPAQQDRNASGYLSGPIVPNRWGFLLYGGRWAQDENASVFATTLNPVSFESTRVATTVPTPFRTTSLSVSLDQMAAANHRLTLGYEWAQTRAIGQGAGGFDLPERAYSSRARDHGISALLMSIRNNAVNEFRVQLNRGLSSTAADLVAPAVLVLDSFNGGGNQDALFLSESTDDLEIGNDYTWGAGEHTVKVGFVSFWTRQRSDDRSNFGGTFIFGTDFERDENGEIIRDLEDNAFPISSLERYRRAVLGLPGYGPSQLSLNRGEPLVELSQWTAGWFAQDDWRLSPGMTVSLGVRYDLQNNVSDFRNVAPRLALAWVPDGDGPSVIRLGLGMFYRPVSMDLEFDTIKLDEDHQQRLIVSDPGFFLDAPDDPSGELLLPLVSYVKAPDLRVPRTLDASVTYERQLGEGVAGTVTYRAQFGRDLLRQRNINAPVGPEFVTSPDPDRGPVLQFESSGASTRHELQFGLNVDLSSTLSSYGSYTLGSSRNDTDGPYSAPASSYDLAAEWGAAADDIRHQMVVGGTVSLPRRWTVSPHVTLTSPQPFNVLTGFDNNGDTVFTDRPAFASPDDPTAVLTAFGLLTSNPQPGDRLVPRNLGREHWLLDVSLRVHKDFDLGSLPGRMSVAADVQNLFNLTRLVGFSGTLNSPTFGTPNSGLEGRRVSLSLGYSF